jgi:hypothetical protein
MKIINGIRFILTLSGWLFTWPGSAQTVSMLASRRMESDIINPASPVPADIEKTNFVVRDIFKLQYGHYRDAIALIDEAMKVNMFPPNGRVLTDFTGEAYRLILESGYHTLADYEKAINTELGQPGWRDWYEKFKVHVESSSREILRWVR